MKRLFSRIAFSLALLALPVLAGDTVESDWLELVKGYKGKSAGVELRDIEPGDTEGTQKITLAVPKKAIEHPDTIEEVVVIGQAPQKPDAPEPIPVRYQWLSDYDEDNYGLVIHIGRNSRWPIRLFMNSDAGFTR